MKLLNLLERMLPHLNGHSQRHHVPEDKLQLDAAQDRLEQRANELEKASDELSKMVRRMKRNRRGDK